MTNEQFLAVYGRITAADDAEYCIAGIVTCKELADNSI